MQNSETSNNKFRYTYSPNTNREVQAIRNKYLPKTESKLEQLKRLDGYVQSAGLTESLIIGIVGCLIFGLAMCVGLEVLGGGIALAVILGIVGGTVMIAAYPTYRKISNHIKAKYSERILNLADEISAEKN